MSNTPGQKLKILRLYQILLELTDEMKPMNAKDIIAELKKYDIKAERKSVYSDIETLMEAGVDVVKDKDGYYIGSRTFELAELKLLVDAVSASKFISNKKSEELIKKIESLTSKNQAKQLSRQLIVPNKAMSDNEKIFYNIDTIYQCIEDNTQMVFQYEEWSLEKKKILRKNGELYVVSPAFLIRNDENYYLVAYDEKNKNIRHYRVDRIVKAEATKDKRGGIEERLELNPEEYAKKHTSMFGGNETVVTLKLRKNLAGVILDKYGKEVTLREADDDFIKVRVPAAISPQFYGWVAGLGGKIVAPAEESEKYIKYLEDVLKL